MNALLPAELRLPGHTLCGPGTLSELPSLLPDFGRQGLIIYGSALEKRQRLDQLRQATTTEHTWFHRHRGGEPTVQEVDEIRQIAAGRATAWIAAIGGGSIIDLGKAAAGLRHAPLPCAAYHGGEAIPQANIPFIAVPTTAGTGSESTIVSVLSDHDKCLKQSIRHPAFMPRLVVLDPDLLADCPPPVIAAAGMDALTQAIESYISRHATPMTMALALTAAVAITDALPLVFSGHPSAGRELLEGSYLAGLALSHSRLGIVHGLAHPLGIRYQAPHGLVCAFCLGPAIAFNQPAIPQRIETLSRHLGRDPSSLAREMIERFGLASPFAGKELPDMQTLAAEVLASGSTKANPRQVSPPDIKQLIEQIFVVPAKRRNYRG